jgi:hypothetical protein
MSGVFQERELAPILLISAKPEMLPSETGIDRDCALNGFPDLIFCTYSIGHQCWLLQAGVGVQMNEERSRFDKR